MHDLNEASFGIIEALLSLGITYFVGVGDKDQVIYSHLGADESFLEHRISSSFPDCARFPLTMTYRHGPHLAYAMEAFKRKPVDSNLPVRTEIREPTYAGAPGACGSEVVKAVLQWKQDGKSLDPAARRPPIHRTGKCAHERGRAIPHADDEQLSAARRDSVSARHARHRAGRFPPRRNARHARSDRGGAGHVCGGSPDAAGAGRGQDHAIERAVGVEALFRWADSACGQCRGAYPYRGGGVVPARPVRRHARPWRPGESPRHHGYG
ncbi:hypothetical protein D3C71_1499880 [compost metagenome]